MRRTALVLALLSPMTVLASTLGDAERHFQPMDVFNLEWASNPAISPDGRQVVYQRNQFDIMRDRRRSHLWLVDADGRRHRPLTTGQGSDGAPTWSPQGDRIAWVSAREGSNQIWLRWMDSGQIAELTQVTESPSNLVFSPDGEWLAFTMRVAADTRPLARMPTRPRGAEWAPSVRVIDRIGYRIDGAGYVRPGYSHVFVVPAEGGTPRQITRGDFQHRAEPVWSADGRSLFVVSNRHPDWERQPQRSELYRVDIETGAMTALTDRDGPDQQPALSPDGRRLAWVGYDDRRLGHQTARLYVADADGSNRRELTANFDYSVQSPAWDRAGRGLYFGYDREGVTRIGWIAVSGGTVEEVVAEVGGTAMGRPYPGGSFSVANGRIAYTHGSVDRPAEVAVVERGRRPRVLTDLNTDALGHKHLGKVEELWLKSSADGLDIQAWIVKPPGFDPARRYPLLLEIHGGPFANYGPRFAPEIQLYASAGYVVLYVNPRGSTSYGEDFANHIHHNYPSQDFDDLISSVDAVIARGYVDPERLYVTGGSGGGVLTAWIVGHSDRFRAAVVAKPVINWTSFVLTADFSPFFTQYWFPQPPWEEGAQAQYWQRSPLAHVGKVNTPTMLITGEDDYRTPISETEQYYQALQLRGIDTAMVRIPGAAHGIHARPSHLIAQVLNTLAWFARYGGNPVPTAPAREAGP